MVVRLTALAALIAGLAGPAHAERMCFQGPMPPTALRGQREVMAGSGGVIVAAGEAMPDWRFRDLNRVVRAHVVVVAPGLAIYHPPPTPGAEVVLEDADHQLIAKRERAFKIEPPAAAPAVASVTASLVQSRKNVQVAFAGATPESAVIAVISRVSGDRLVPLAWARVGGAVRSLSIWHTPYTCEQTVTTWLEPKQGDTVVISWVDDAGRISEPSKSIVISGASMRK